MGAILAVGVAGTPDDEPTSLRVVSVTDGKVNTSSFYGSSLSEVIAAAAAVLDIEAVTFNDPDGNVTTQRIPIQAEEDAITFRARLAGGRLMVYQADDEDTDDSYMRLMSVEVDGRAMEIFKGVNLSDCIAAAKRYLRIHAVDLGRHVS